MATETDQRPTCNGHGRNLPQFLHNFVAHSGSGAVSSKLTMVHFSPARYRQITLAVSCVIPLRVERMLLPRIPPSRIRNMNSICPRSVARFGPSMSLLHNQPRVPRSGEIFPDWLTKTNTAASLHLPGPIQERDPPPKRLLRLLESFQTKPQSDGRSPSH